MFDHCARSAASASSSVAADELPAIDLLIAAPRGFCAGVRRAIEAAETALRHHSAPVYVRRPIVHNMAVVRALEAKGAVFVEELDQVPEGGVVVLSAHGVAPDIAADAVQRSLISYDAVCPLVAKVHREVERYSRSGRHVILVGHEGHPEVVGTLGHVPTERASLVASAAEAAALDLPEETPVGIAVQTTYSVEEAADVLQVLRARFPNLVEPQASDICYATTNRQAAVRAIAARADAMIVAGESFSSNACRLAEVATAAGCRSVQRIADGSEIDWARLPSRGTIGLTAAASTPDGIIEDIQERLARRYRVRLEEVKAAEESVKFKPVVIG